MEFDREPPVVALVESFAADVKSETIAITIREIRQNRNPPWRNPFNQAGLVTSVD
jgi:hypothetical protein